MKAINLNQAVGQEKIWLVDWHEGEVVVTDANGRRLRVDSGAGIVLGELVVPEPTLASNGKQRYSPKHDYVARCEDGAIHLYDGAGHQLLGEANLVADCWTINWRYDSSAFAFQSNGEAYVWYVDKATPTRIARGVPPYSTLRWSPDGSRLAYAYCDFNAEKAYAVVLTNSGEIAIEFQVSGCGATWEGQIDWLTNDVLVEPLRYGTTLTAYEYYVVATGEKLGFNIESFDAPSQRPFLSPDQHWHILEETNGFMGTNFVYAVYDLQKQRGDVLSDSLTTHLQLLGWKNDSSAFYVVSRPVDETAQSHPGVPFGLLALDLQSRTFTQLFKQAVFAELSPDQKFAWVVFPAKREDGTLGLDGGLFDMATATLTARQFVADTMLYGNPADGGLVPTAWDHAGKQLVFSDSDGGLTVVKTNGEAQTLTTDLPITGDVWPYNVRLEWSPDDAHLLVQYGERAWVVTVP